MAETIKMASQPQLLISSDSYVSSQFDESPFNVFRYGKALILEKENHEAMFFYLQETQITRYDKLYDIGSLFSDYDTIYTLEQQEDVDKFFYTQEDLFTAYISIHPDIAILERTVYTYFDLFGDIGGL